MKHSVSFKRRGYSLPLLGMSIVAAIIAIASASLSSRTSTTHAICTSAIAGLSLGLLILGLGRGETLSVNRNGQVRNGRGRLVLSSVARLKIEFTKDALAPNGRFMLLACANPSNESLTVRLYDAALPSEVLRCTESLVRCLGGSLLAFDIRVVGDMSVVGTGPLPLIREQHGSNDVTLENGIEVLSRVIQPRCLVPDVLGVVGGLFVTAVGTGVVIAQLGRTGAIGPFSVCLLAVLFVIAVWFVHLGLSLRYRIRTTEAGQIVEHFGLFGYRSVITVPPDTNHLWLLSGVETEPRYLLFSSKQGWNSVPIEGSCRRFR